MKVRIEHKINELEEAIIELIVNAYQSDSLLSVEDIRQTVKDSLMIDWMEIEQAMCDAEEIVEDEEDEDES